MTSNPTCAATQWRKRPVIITASQWFKNGDHPEDFAEDSHGLESGKLRIFTGAERKANNWEGGVVRYFRHPDVPGDRPCEQCGKTHLVHGWIDTLEQGHRVCPGDWIITGVKGERYPCKPDIFEATYEAVLASPDPANFGLRAFVDAEDYLQFREWQKRVKAAPVVAPPEICSNCGTELPGGCCGLFADEGPACKWNAAQEKKADG
jgi:hypothetical protein